METLLALCEDDSDFDMCDDDPPLTIREAFEQDMPDIPSEDIEYRVISSTAKSTLNQPPLLGFILDDPEKLLANAFSGLDMLEGLGSLCLEREMPQDEPGYYICTESDISRVSALQLVHPVNVVLSSLIPKNASIRCLSEVPSHSGKSRTDLKWVYVPEDVSEDGDMRKEETVVAILEYKNTKAICFDDFEQAATTPQNAARMARWSKRVGKDTLLENNAIVLSQQMLKYSHECEDVVIFDWLSMFIFDFSEMDAGSAAALRPDNNLARGIFSDESSQFRPLLLGMIIQSLLRRGFLR